MFRLKFLILLSTIGVVGCPTTSMLQTTTSELQPPPKREHYNNNSAYLSAIDAYQQYLETYKAGVRTPVRKETNVPSCKSVIISREYVIPTAPVIQSDNLEDQVNALLDYIDVIRDSAKTHNEIVRKQVELFNVVCPSVDKYVVP